MSESSNEEPQFPTDPPFFDPNGEVEFLSGKLPHWRQAGKIYFVTFRLADSLPQEKLQQLRVELLEWKATNPPPHNAEQLKEYYELFSFRPQAWLDAGYGSCILRLPEPRTLLENALSYLAGTRYNLSSYVIAANHVHAIVQPVNGYSLSQILHSWKSFTGHKILKMDAARERLVDSWKRLYPNDEKPVKVWQKESFDHIIRSPASMERFAEYIEGHKK